MESGGDVGQIVSVTSLDDRGCFDVIISSLRPVGTGATGFVLEGRTCDVDGENCLVALKVFSAVLDANQRDILIRELRIARHCHQAHPGILPILGITTIGLNPTIVSPLMENGNLLQYVKTHRSVDPKALIIEVASIVCYIHDDLHLVHGDLKCENVLVSAQGRVVLADFGLSRFPEDLERQLGLRTGTTFRCAHTLRFAAPELLVERPPPQTTHSDVFAFGMLILQALTGCQPWAGMSDLQVLCNVRRGKNPPRPPRTCGMNDTWWSTCRSCWSMQHLARPPMRNILLDLSYPGRIPLKSTAFSSPIVVVAFSKCGQRLLSGDWDGNIDVWYLGNLGKTVKGLHHPRIHIQTTLGLTDVVFTLDGRIASCGMDGAIRFWSSYTGGRIAHPLEGHGGEINSISCSPDRRRLASATEDGHVTIWDIVTGRPLKRLLGEDGVAVHTVIFAACQARIVAGSCTMIHIWDSYSYNLLGTLFSQSQMTRISCTADGTRILSVNRDKTISLWDAVHCRLERVIPEHSNIVTSAVLFPDGLYFASASEDWTVRVWEAATGNQLRQPFPPQNYTATAVSPTGTEMVTGTKRGEVTLWDFLADS